MALKDVINTLRKEEQHLVRQLSSVRSAMSALGSNITYIATGRGRPRGTKKAKPGRKRKLSAKARRAISKAQKARWKQHKAAQKKAGEKK